jgi:hypothetical protein
MTPGTDITSDFRNRSLNVEGVKSFPTARGMVAKTNPNIMDP